MQVASTHILGSAADVWRALFPLSTDLGPLLVCLVEIRFG